MANSFEDPSFINYLIDNMNQALIESENDLENFLEKMRDEAIKDYFKKKKKEEKKSSIMNMIKKLAINLKKIGESNKDLIRIYTVDETTPSPKPLKINSESIFSQTKHSADSKQISEFKPGKGSTFENPGSFFNPKSNQIF